MNWWETDFASVKRNKLYLAGRQAESLAREFGTPLYVYGKKAVLARYDILEKTMAADGSRKSWICYAMKANPHRGLLALLGKRGARIDAVSPNEVDAALAAGFPPERILFTGTSVSVADLERLMTVDGLTLNIDAPEQLEMMGAFKRRKCPGKRIRVSVRWNPGIGSGFNPRVITAGRRSSDGTPIKFGVEESKVVGVFERAKALGFVPVGLHHHLGSGWVRDDFGTVREAADKMVRMAGELERRRVPLEFLDFGGGFGPRYARDQGLFPVARYLRHISRAVAKAGLGVKAVAVEPGKFLVGDSGALLLRLEYVKESYGNLFACVNGGTYNTVPRPAIYLQAFHEIVNASRVGGNPKARLTVAGNLCETGDVFGKERLMPLPKSGDVLAVLGAGAYCRSMASTFNLRDIPREILI
ncbi:MAG: diaminopimelate decarboxylase [Candidatus Aminicenantales bacterium]